MWLWQRQMWKIPHSRKAHIKNSYAVKAAQTTNGIGQITNNHINLKTVGTQKERELHIKHIPNTSYETKEEEKNETVKYKKESTISFLVFEDTY